MKEGPSAKHISSRALGLRYLLPTLMLAITAVAGCGDDDRVAGKPSQPEATTRAKQEPSSEKKAHAKSKRPGAPPARTSAELDRPGFIAADQGAAKTAKRERNSLRQLIRGALTPLGFGKASVKLARDGRSAGIRLPPATACTARAKDERLIEMRVRSAAPKLTSVSVSVSGFRGSLASYLRKRCQPPDHPSNKGKLIYKQSGTGIVDTRPFRIPTRRWRIAYESYGAILQIFVYRDKRLYDTPVTHVRRGHDTKSLTGKGRFHLRISGSADWKVRVYSIP